MAPFPEQPRDHSVSALLLWIDLLRDDLQAIKRREATKDRTIRLLEARVVEVQQRYAEKTGELL